MTTLNTVVRARIDQKTKEDAEAVLAAIGLSLSDAVRLMMIRIAREGALPFEPFIPNKETVQAIKEARAGKIKRFDSVSGLFADLKAEEPDAENRDEEEVQERLPESPRRKSRS
jgi:DNA-damage-inducible protein J